jgi:hypothetical protein
VVVNWSSGPSQGKVRTCWDDLGGRQWELVDLLDGRNFVRDGDDMSSSGLFVDLPGYGYHVLRLT